LLQVKFQLKQREQIDPFWLFLVAVLKLLPEVLLFPKKLGGRIQGVPLPITERKQLSFFTK
jgi:hypothetical protein